MEYKKLAFPGAEDRDHDISCVWVNFAVAAVTGWRESSEQAMTEHDIIHNSARVADAMTAEYAKRFLGEGKGNA